MGIRDGLRGCNVKIIIHIHSVEWNTIKLFYNKLKKYGIEYDVIGLSYYPWWSRSIDKLVDSINKTIQYFGKPIILKTAYPHKDIEIDQIPYAIGEYMLWGTNSIGQAEFIQGSFE